MSKLMYLAKANPKFESNKDEFVARWRMHGAKGMSVTEMWKPTIAYVQAEVLHNEKLEGFNYEYDGIGYSITDDSIVVDYAAIPQEDIMGIVQDETETFAVPTSENLMFVEEIKLKDGFIGGVTAFLYYKDAETAKKVAETCKNIELATRIILDLKIDNEQFKSNYKAAIEISAKTFANLKKIVTTDAKEAVETADYATITREAVLWDRISE